MNGDLVRQLLKKPNGNSNRANEFLNSLLSRLLLLVYYGSSLILVWNCFVLAESVVWFHNYCPNLAIFDFHPDYPITPGGRLARVLEYR